MPALHPDMEILPGYRLVARLGNGAVGEVWKAIGPAGVPAAFKFLRGDELGARYEVQALVLMKHVRHPHLLIIFGIWSIEALTVIGMELADCGLHQRFRECIDQGHQGGSHSPGCSST